MMATCIYPGSFDPPTVGHVDIVRRASRLYERVIVAVLDNGAKKCLFSPEERAALFARCISDVPNASVLTDGGLLADVARRAGADVILRGLRGEADVALESQMAAINKRLCALETVFLFSSPEHVPISSTVVREVASHGGRVEGLAPAEICVDIERRFL